MVSRVVFDIETAGYPFESLDPQQQDYLLRFAETEEERAQERLKVNLYPYTAEVVSIGLLNVDTLHGQVLIQAPPGTSAWHSNDGAIEFLPGDERTLLVRFWEIITRYDQFVTFNGRGFDCPFLMIRSAMLRVRATRNLMPPRYDAGIHCDLLEQLTFHGAYRKFSLDFICTSFGIDSPKRHGVTGLDINTLHREGRFQDIAEYNARDLLATAELFHRWDGYMRA